MPGANELSIFDIVKICALFEALRPMDASIFSSEDFKIPLAHSPRTVARILARAHHLQVIELVDEGDQTGILHKKFKFASSIDVDFWNMAKNRLKDSVVLNNPSIKNMFSETSTEEMIFYLNRNLEAKLGFQLPDNELEPASSRSWLIINTALRFFNMPQIQSILKYTVSNLWQKSKFESDKYKYVLKNLAPKIEAYVYRALDGEWQFGDPVWDKVQRRSALWKVLSLNALNQDEDRYYGPSRWLVEIPDPKSLFAALPVIADFPKRRIARLIANMDLSERIWILVTHDGILRLKPSENFESERRKIPDDPDYKFHYSMVDASLGDDNEAERFRAVSELINIADDLWLSGYCGLAN